MWNVHSSSVETSTLDPKHDYDVTGLKALHLGDGDLAWFNVLNNNNTVSPPCPCLMKIKRFRKKNTNNKISALTILNTEITGLMTCLGTKL